jgi:hypothetical protein
LENKKSHNAFVREWPGFSHSTISDSETNMNMLKINYFFDEI